MSMHDKDGNPLPDIDPMSNVGQAVALLHHARKHGFRVGPLIKVGDVVIQVQDLEQSPGRNLEMPEDRGPWAAAGLDDEKDGDR